MHNAPASAVPTGAFTAGTLYLAADPSSFKGKLRDTLDVNLDCPGREIAQSHVLDHSLSQGSHGELLS
jgi:hypothetical protein